MGQVASIAALPVIDRHSINRLETHFIAPEIYRRDDVAVRQMKIARIVSDDIVPRLLRLHTQIVPDAPPVAAFVEALAPSSAEIGTLADIVLGPDLEAAAAYVTTLRDRGLSMETLYVELLEPTARRLGAMWEEDECDFIDVTLGVARLQKLLAIFNDTHHVAELDTRRTVLMASAPGNQHSLGIAIVERFLRGAGWQVQTELSGSAARIVKATRENWFAVIGLTAASDGQIDALKATIADIRNGSANPSIGIMVGGPIFKADPAVADDVGADATAADAPTAVLTAQKLFDLAVRDRSPRMVGARGH